MAYRHFFGRNLSVEDSIAKIKDHTGVDPEVVAEGFDWLSLCIVNDGERTCTKLATTGITNLTQTGMNKYANQIFVQEAGCRLFARLAYFGNKQVRLILVASDAGQTIIDVLNRYPDSQDIIERGYPALYHLMKEEENIAILRCIHGIKETIMAVTPKYHRGMLRNGDGTAIDIGRAGYEMIGKLTGTDKAPDTPSASTPSPPPRHSSVHQSAIDQLKLKAEQARAEAEKLEKAVEALMELE